MTATTYISLDVALTITSALEPGNPKQSLHSVSLFVLTTVWPGVCVLLSIPLVPRMTPDVTRSATLLYFTLMVWVVARVLHEMRPLVYYILAAILFILAQLAYFLISRPICNGTNAKIDGSFIKSLASDPSDRVFVEALVHLAKSFGMDTVAEWVGDQTSVDILSEIGVTYLQGFHFGEPKLALYDADGRPRIVAA